MRTRPQGRLVSSTTGLPVVAEVWLVVVRGSSKGCLEDLQGRGCREAAAAEWKGEGHRNRVVG